jgi:hypothetical protein
MNQDTKGQPPADDERHHTLRIEDSDDPIAWRCYPGQETTVGEMYAACTQLGLRCWVDLDGEVCLIVAQTKNMPAGPDLPDGEELARAMWGLDTPESVDVVTRQSRLPLRSPR